VPLFVVAGLDVKAQIEKAAIDKKGKKSTKKVAVL
jgi:hypothetical protein